MKGIFTERSWVEMTRNALDNVEDRQMQVNSISRIDVAARVLVPMSYFLCLIFYMYAYVWTFEPVIVPDARDTFLYWLASIKASKILRSLFFQLYNCLYWNRWSMRFASFLWLLSTNREPFLAFVETVAFVMIGACCWCVDYELSTL